jgi:hypothetical protein
MRRIVLCLAALPALARADPTEAERQVERALIERDRQAAEFARPELRNMPQPSAAEPLRPDERSMRAREREAYELGLPTQQPPAPAPSQGPLPLPGGPADVVDPIPVQGTRGKTGVDGK